MKRYISLVILSIVWVCACNSSAEVEKYPWKPFNFAEAGFKADFPCEPKTDIQTFQKTPKPVRRYVAICKYQEFEFMADLSEWFEDFDESKVEQHFDIYEKSFRKSLGKNEDVLKISNTTLADGTPAKFVDARSGQLMYRELHFENSRGIYSVVVKTSGDPNIPVINSGIFDASVKRFLDSFESTKR